MSPNINIVTQCFPPRIGGIEQVMNAIARELTLENWQVKIFTDYHAEVPYDASIIALPLLKRALKYLRPHFKRQLIAQHTCADLTICDTWKSISAVPEEYTGKILVFAHAQELLNTKKLTKMRHAFARVSHVICSSYYTQKLLKERCSCKEVSVIYPCYGLESSLPKNSLQVQGTLQKDVTGQLQLLTISRLDKRKGICESLSALKELVSQNRIQPFQWHIIGTGNLRSTLVHEIDQFHKTVGDGYQIFLHGSKEAHDLAAFYERAHLFVMPSIELKHSVEGFGISYVAAARYGIPSIAGLSGGAPEAVIDGITGWCIDATNIDELSNTLQLATSDRQNLAMTGKQAQEYYDEHFTGKRAFELFKRLIPNQ